jgi:hypothetical protein
VKLSLRSLRASIRWLKTYPRYDVAPTQKEAARVSYQLGYQAGYRAARRGVQPEG